MFEEYSFPFILKRDKFVHSGTIQKCIIALGNE